MKNKQDTIKFYDAEAEQWTQLRPDKENRLKKTIEYANIGNDMNVLDIGCAIGMCAPLCLERNIKFYHGIDISPNMIKRAKENYTDSRVYFQCCDIENIHFEKLYDRILLFSVIPHIENLELFFMKIYEALDSNGKICIANYKSGKQDLNNRVWNMSEQTIIDILRKNYCIERVINDNEKFVVLASKNNHEIG